MMCEPKENVSGRTGVKGSAILSFLVRSLDHLSRPLTIMIGLVVVHCLFFLIRLFKLGRVSANTQTPNITDQFGFELYALLVATFRLFDPYGNTLNGILSRCIKIFSSDEIISSHPQIPTLPSNSPCTYVKNVNNKGEIYSLEVDYLVNSSEVDIVITNNRDVDIPHTLKNQDVYKTKGHQHFVIQSDISIENVYEDLQSTPKRVRPFDYLFSRCRLPVVRQSIVDFNLDDSFLINCLDQVQTRFMQMLFYLYGYCYLIGDGIVRRAKNSLNKMMECLYISYMFSGFIVGFLEGFLEEIFKYKRSVWFLLSCILYERRLNLYAFLCMFILTTYLLTDLIDIFTNQLRRNPERRVVVMTYDTMTVQSKVEQSHEDWFQKKYRKEIKMSKLEQEKHKKFPSWDRHTNDNLYHGKIYEDENNHNLTGRIFDTNDYYHRRKGIIKIGNFLRWIHWEQMPHVIGSLLKYKPKCKTPTEVQEANEMRRRIKHISTNWMKVEGIDLLREILVDIYNIDPYIIVNGTKEFRVNPRIYIDVPEFTWQSKLSVTYEGELAFLKSAKSSKQWPEKKIRSTVKNLLYQNKSEEQIIKFFSKTFYVPPLHNTWTEKGNLDQLSWSVPYLPDIVYNITSTELTSKEVCDIFQPRFINLKNRAINFVRLLISYSKMTEKEKKEAKMARIERFKNKMREPENQQLFLTGVNKQIICDKINQEIIIENDLSVIKSVKFVKSREKFKQTKDLNRQKCRDMKMYNEEDFELQRLTGNWEDFCEGTQSFFSRLITSISSYGFAFPYIGIPIFSVFSNFILMKYMFGEVSNTVVSEIDDATRTWKAFFLSPFDWAAKAENKITLVQVNSVFQIINLMFKQKYDEIYGHAINLGITSWDKIGALIAFASHTFDPSQASFYEINGCTRYGTAENYANDMYNYMHGLPLEERIIGQAGEPSFLESFFSIGSSGLWSAKGVSEMNQKFIFVKNASKIASDTVEFFKAIVSIVGRTFFGVDPFCYEFMEYTKAINEVLQKIAIIERMSPKDRYTRDKAVAIYQLDVRIRTLRDDPLYQTLPSYKIAYFLSEIKRFEVFYHECKSLNGMLQERIEPTSVMILGAPGSGKSASVKFIERGLQYKHFIKDGWAKSNVSPEDVYTLNSIDRFYSGYRNQNFVEIDDIFKSVNTADRSLEAQEIINIVNTAAYPLNMASLEAKGSTFFDSPYVFMTTNIVEKSLKKSNLQLGLTDNGAFIRRLHLVLIRNEKISGTFPHNQTFVIDQCINYPELEGKVINIADVILLIYKLRENKIQQLQNRDFDEDKMRSFLETEYTPISDQTSKFIREKINETDIVSKLIADKNTQSKDVNMEEFLRLAGENLDDEEAQMRLAMATLGLKQVTFNENDDRKEWETIKSNRQPVTVDHLQSDEEKTFPFSDYVKFLQFDLEHGILPWYEENSWRNIMIFVFVGIICSSLLVTLYVVFIKRVDKEEADDEFFSTESSFKKKEKSGTYKKRAMQKRAGIEIDTQSGMETPVTNFDKSFPNLMSGTGIIVAKWMNEDGKYIYNSAQCSHMCDGWFLTCTHFFTANPKDSTFMIRMEDREYVMEKFEVIKIARDLDIALCKIPSKNQLPKALISYLPKSYNETPIIEGTPMRIVSTDKRGIHDFKPVNKFGTMEYHIYPSAGHWFQYETNVMYLAKTEKGDSGSIITIQGKQDRPLIVGMHVGLRTRNGAALGIATPVYQDLIRQLMNHVKTEEIKDEASLSPQCENSFPHRILKYVDESQAYNKPRKHSIKPSVLYEWMGEPTSIPARLTPFEKNGVIIDPYINGVKKLHQEYTEPCKIPEGTEEWLLSMYPPQEDRKLLDFEEVIRGTGEFFTSVNAGTSPGYPYCLEKHNGKGPWITVEEENYTVIWNDEIEKIVNDMETDLRNGKQIEVIWADVLKAERRDIDKVEAGKTRLFASCPLHYLLLMRKYLGKITEYMQSQCVTKPISVGINPHSLDWAMIYNRLSTTNGSVIAGDFSNYDGVVPRFVGEVVLKFVNEWYDDGEVNANVRKLLFEHIYNATRINDNFIYQVKDGNPSGNPWTSWYNSLCQLVMWYTVMTLEFKLDPSTWNIVVYGDDNVVTTMKKGLRVSDFKPHFKKYFGMDYTHFSKKEVDPHDTLDTIRYLGRKFVKTEFPWMFAPLELNVIVESLYWTNGSQRNTIALFSTVESFVLELFHFGREDYKTYRYKLLEWINENVLDETIKYGIKQRLMMPYNTIYNRNYLGFESASKMVGTQAGRLYEIDFPEQTSSIALTSNVDVNQPNKTEEVELGSYHDQNRGIINSCNHDMIQDPYKEFNMETFDLNKSLEREYPINTLDWNSTQARDTNLLVISFPEILFNQPFIQQKIDDFHYFKGSIRLTFRVTANQFLYGAIMASYLPYPSDNTSVPNDTIKSASGLPHVNITTGSSEPVVMDIPFICKDRMLNILNYLPSQMAQVTLLCLVPLTDVQTGGPCSAQVFITAQFRDVELALPICTQSSVSQEAVMKSSKGIISNTLEDIADIVSVVKNVPFIGQYGSMFEGITRPAASMARRLGLSKPTTLALTEVGKINPYVDINQGRGLDLAPKFGFDPSNRISTIPNVGSQSVDDLRLMLGVPASYKWHDIQRQVLDVAKKELKEKANIEIEIEKTKNGRKISKLNFMFAEMS